ncbi:MAG: CNNM domain-containing protein [Planctomycetota bacterium]
MIWAVLVMLLLGLGLSAFFSGSETGFYRVARVRLALDARDGDRVSKMLLWLTNNPSYFVATTLIGNNLANYLLSFAILILTRWALGGGEELTEILGPLLASPFVFVYAELLPKNLFYLAPNRLLRWGGPFFLICAIIFAPVTCILWTLARLLQAVVGEAPEAVRSRLARNELRRLLQAGQHMGILQPAQERMAQAVFDAARLTLPRRFPSQLARVSASASLAQARRATRRSRHGQAIVMRPGGRTPVGYIRFRDLLHDLDDWGTAIRELPRIPLGDAPLTAVMHLRDRDETLGAVVDQQSRVVGIVSMDELVDRVIGT